MERSRVQVPITATVWSVKKDYNLTDLYCRQCGGTFEGGERMDSESAPFGTEICGARAGSTFAVKHGEV